MLHSLPHQILSSLSTTVPLYMAVFHHVTEPWFPMLRCLSLKTRRLQSPASESECWVKSHTLLSCCIWGKPITALHFNPNCVTEGRFLSWGAPHKLLSIGHPILVCDFQHTDSFQFTMDGLLWSFRHSPNMLLNIHGKFCHFCQAQPEHFLKMKASAWCRRWGHLHGSNEMYTLRLCTSIPVISCISTFLFLGIHAD